MKIANLSVKELLHIVDIAVKAALTVPELQKVLKAHSIDEKKMQVGLDLAQKVVVWQDRQDTAQAQTRQSQHTFKDVLRSIKALYRSHRETARFAYREDVAQQQKLGLPGARAARYAEWRNQTEKFYTHLDTKLMAKYGLPAAEITEVKALLSKLSELEVLRNDARRQAQQATYGKRMAVQELRSWFARFMRVARVACTDDPQLLESMGIVVPS
ncbi:MAG: hypothetical protein RIG62_20420 [Cyclobacteriaceae bacterium]